jgi:transcriptional regulator with XRE-family HTH domain
MPSISLKNLGTRVAEKRGVQRIRATAKEIGISAATLSRIENGHMPDLETFRLVCDWLQVNPAEVLGSKVAESNQFSSPWTVHFKKNKAVTEKTAKALADMILAATTMLEAKEGE